MDVVVTVPKGQWLDWIAEGDLPGESAVYDSHFWIPFGNLPRIAPGERVYVVAHGRLRGYAPLHSIERRCRMAASRSCLLRRGEAEAVTIPEAIRGFQGWRYRWWEREAEAAFPDWQTFLVLPLREATAMTTMPDLWGEPRPVPQDWPCIPCGAWNPQEAATCRACGERRAK